MSFICHPVVVLEPPDCPDHTQQQQQKQLKPVVNQSPPEVSLWLTMAVVMDLAMAMVTTMDIAMAMAMAMAGQRLP